ncbi:hypothetical protein MJ1HA_0070 [Metallosphaera sedula]|nr:hypothetical protein MJ1HA_0070 [Metallosphaera sedula]
MLNNVNNDWDKTSLNEGQKCPGVPGTIPPYTPSEKSVRQLSVCRTTLRNLSISHTHRGQKDIKDLTQREICPFTYSKIFRG